MLEKARADLYRMKEWLVQHEKEAKARHVFFAGRAIIKQYRMIVYALVQWIEEVIEEYRQTEDFGIPSFDGTIEKP